MSAQSIPATDIRIGDAIASTYLSGSPTVVRTLEWHPTDSILPHVLVNGIRTIALRTIVEVSR